MTNCLTWCWQELLERWENEQAKIYVGNATRSTSSIPTNTFPGKITISSDLRNETDEKAKTRKQRCVSKKEPVFHDSWPVDAA